MKSGKSVPPVPAPGDGKRGEEGYLGYLLRQAAHVSRLHMEQALADVGITHPQFIVLTMIGAYPGLSGADIARLALLTPPTVSVIIRNLKRSGLVTSRQHKSHGRIQQLEITGAGKRKLKSCRGHVTEAEAQLAMDLSATELKVVRKWLAAVASTDASISA